MDALAGHERHRPPRPAARSALALPKVAFLILAHRDPPQLARLVRALGSEADVYVHVDGKVPVEPFAAACPWPHVRFVDDRAVVWWGGWSMVEATRRLLRDALADGSPYEALVVLSGGCFPIRPIDDLRRLVAGRPDHSFIRFVDARPHRELRRRYDRYWVWDSPLDRLGLPPSAPALLLGRALKRPARWTGMLIRKRLDAFLDRYTPAWGSQWCALSGGCARHVLRVLDEDAHLRHVYGWSFVPDEQAIHTIVASSPFLDRSDGFSEFRGESLTSVANLHWLSPAYPDVIDERRFDEIAASGRYFARKTVYGVSDRLLDRIERELL